VSWAVDWWFGWLDRWLVGWSGFGFESSLFDGSIKGEAALAIVSADGGKGARRREEDPVEVDLLRGRRSGGGGGGRKARLIQFQQ
jgi:hypothetical protein